MRVLVTSTPAPTHFTPLVPLAWALRAAGHEVLVAAQPDVMDAVRSAGLNGVSIGPWFHGDDMMLALVGDKRPVEAIPRTPPEALGQLGYTWMVHTRYMLPEQLAFAREYRPDLIVADPMDYGSLIVGGALGVPVVHHRWCADPISGPARRAMAPHLRRWCTDAGVPGLPDPDLVLDPCPPTLQHPDAEPGTPIRYVPYNGNGVFPSWLAELRDGSTERTPRGRRVVVSLGTYTLLLNGTSLLGRVLGAFDGLPDTEVIATVPVRHRDEVGAVPANVRVVDPTPLHLLVPGSDLVVHHGGAGTVLSALVSGVPQLALPQLGDTFANSDRLAATGAGITLDTAQAQDDPARLREAVEQLLTDPGYAKTAGELRQEMADMPTPAEVVAVLERLARGTGLRAPG
ncbi:DUF1205 domain-containing protein [Streptomyces pimonensis]|uniref:DUF1205 domain-containing protein n=1 Tax=Streptomyces pimonensis TaxID=2860288 RepID=A0ABV4J6J6_9ACTN